MTRFVRDEHGDPVYPRDVLPLVDHMNIDIQVCVCWQPVTVDELCEHDNPVCPTCCDRECLDPRDSRAGVPGRNL